MRSSTIQRAPVPRDADRTPMGINLGIGAVAVVAGAVLVAFVPAVHLWWRLGLMALLVAGFAAITVDQAALGGVALLVWLVANGFFENHLGELSWHGATDLSFAMVLVVAAAAGLGVGQAYRAMAGWRARYALACAIDGLIGDEEETRGG
jgi:hypothetical protein